MLIQPGANRYDAVTGYELLLIEVMTVQELFILITMNWWKLVCCAELLAVSHTVDPISWALPLISAFIHC